MMPPRGVRRKLAKTGGEGHQTKARLRLAEQRQYQLRTTLRQEEAFRLKSEGKSYTEIALEMDTSEQRARQLYYAALNARSAPPEEVEEQRRLEGMRLDALREAVWERAIRGGDDKAVRTALFIHDRIAKLWGLTAPEKVELNITVKAQLMQLMVVRLDSAMTAAGIPVEQQQQVAAALLQPLEEEKTA